MEGVLGVIYRHKTPSRTPPRLGFELDYGTELHTETNKERNSSAMNGIERTESSFLT